MQFAHRALGLGEDARAGEAGLLVEGGDVFLVAREAVETLGQHDIGAGPAQMRQQRLIAGPQ